MLVPNRCRLNRLKMIRLLDELESESGRATSVFVPRLVPELELEKTLGIVINSEEFMSNVITEITRSEMGAVLFWGERERCLVLPPFPISEKLFSSGYDVEPLRSLLRREFMLALILVRLGDYAIGVYRGEKLLSSKVGTGHIHARHKKGGSSQRRFERGREKQIEDFFDRVCTRVRERLEPYKAQLDYVVYGGEHHTLLSFRKQCHYLRQVDDRTFGQVLNIRRPRQATLQDAIDEIWSSEVIRWQES